MSFRKVVLSGAVGLAAVAATIATTGAAHAAPLPKHDPVAVAAVELLSGGNEQYAVVNAHAPGNPKGFVDYTNFSVAAPSHVWSLNTGQSDELTVRALGHTYEHTLNAGEVLKALSNNDVAFTGTGFYNPIPSDTWSIAGNVAGNRVMFTITYGAWAVPAYHATMQGRINFNGSAFGVFKDSDNQVGTWSLPAGTFRTVLNYAAPIQRDAISVNLRRHTADANVLFRIPFGNPYSGTEVDWNFGTIFGHKFWEQGVNGGALSPETVEAGLIAIS